MDDKILAPSHYTRGEMEAWDAIVALGCGYLDGNVIKYLSRFRHKGDPLGDLKKARAYIDKLIEVTQASIDSQAEREQRATEVEEPYVEPPTSSVFWPYDVRTSTGKSSNLDQRARAERRQDKTTAHGTDCAGLHHDD